MSFLKRLFGKQPGGSIFGNLLRGAVKAIPVVGGSLGNGGNLIPAGSTDGKTNAQIAGMSTGAYNGSIGAGIVPPPKSPDPPTVEGVLAQGGFPEKSQVFPNGSDPTTLKQVEIVGRRASSPIDVDLDWKQGRVKVGNNSDQNNMLLFGMLGLGALVLLKQK